MKLIVASLLILMTVAVVVQTESGAAFDFNSHSQASDPDVKSMETKIAESLHKITSASPINSSINSSENNSSINGTSRNSSMVNASAKLNGSGGSTITGGLSVSSQGLGSSSKGAIKGFWSIQANKHVMGQSDIKSKMVLSGTFEVDKTLKFSE